MEAAYERMRKNDMKVVQSEHEKHYLLIGHICKSKVGHMVQYPALCMSFGIKVSSLSWITGVSGVYNKHIYKNMITYIHVTNI